MIDFTFFWDGAMPVEETNKKLRIGKAITKGFSKNLCGLEILF